MRLVCYSLRSGIWKNLAKMSEETIPHAILLCRDTTLAVSSTYTKRFLYIRPFLLVEHCKDSFFVQYDALVMSIISSKIRKLGLSRRKDTGKEKEKREFHPLILKIFPRFYSLSLFKLYLFNNILTCEALN